MKQNNFGGLTTMFTIIGAVGVGYLGGRFHMLSQAKKASPELAENGEVSVFGIINKNKPKIETETSNA